MRGFFLCLNDIFEESDIYQLIFNTMKSFNKKCKYLLCTKKQDICLKR